MKHLKHQKRQSGNGDGRGTKHVGGSIPTAPSGPVILPGLSPADFSFNAQAKKPGAPAAQLGTPHSNLHQAASQAFGGISSLDGGANAPGGSAPSLGVFMPAMPNSPNRTGDTNGGAVSNPIRSKSL